MSDISLGPGIGVFLFSVLTVGLGLALMLLAALAALLTAAKGERLRTRVARFSAGPFACLGCGVAFFLLQATDRDELARLDDWSLAFPIIGVAVAASVAIALATARRVRRSPQERVVAMKGAAVGGLVSLGLALVGYAIFGDDPLFRRSHLCLWLPLISATAVFLVGALAAVKKKPGGAEGSRALGTSDR